MHDERGWPPRPQEPGLENPASAVTSGRRGPDELSPALIRQGLCTRFVGQDVTYLRSVDSTNVVAARAASRGAAEGLLVIAEEQTVGRGRLGRRWVSPPGVGLWFSVVLRPTGLPPAAIGRLLMLTGCAVAQAIERVARLSPWLKWPNDVLVNGRKVGGLLGQAGLPLPLGGEGRGYSPAQPGEGGFLAWTVVGVGLNVNADEATMQAIAPGASSLLVERGKPVSRVRLLRAILEGLETRYQALRAGEEERLRREWAARLETLGQSVAVVTPAGTLEGLAEDVDADGALLLRLPDGRLERLLAGDVTLRNELSRIGT